MAIEHYAKGTSLPLAANFNVAEFACQGTDCNCTEILIHSELVKHLQQIRDHFGVPVTINSGYRCPAHNEEIGGATNSKHMQGIAADITVYNVAPAEVAKYAESIGILGIGLYETATDGYFVHIDTRTQKFFWYGQAETPRDTFGGTPQLPPTEAPTPGMINAHSSEFAYRTSYSLEDTPAHLYILTCALNQNASVFTVLIDANACKAFHAPLNFRIGNSDSWIQCHWDEPQKTVTFTALNLGVTTGYICHVAAYA